MSVDPNTISKGESSTLFWSSTNVDTVIIDNGIGSVATSGSLSISPIDASTYTGIFTGAEGQITCAASISVTSGGGGGGGGGGSNPPSVSLSSIFTPLIPSIPEPSFIYLSQVPYTGFWNEIKNKINFIMVEIGY